MRILLAHNSLYYPSHGGGDKSNRLLMEALAARGHTVTVVARIERFGSTEHDRLVRDLAARNVDAYSANDGIVRFKLNGVDVHVAAMEPNLRAYFTKQITEFAPDIIVTSTDDPGQLLIEPAVRAPRARVVYLVRATIAVPFGPDGSAPNQAKAELLKAADGVVGVSNYVANYVRKWGGLDAIHVPISLLDAGESYPELGRFDSPYVAMVNPCAVKGITIFLELAKRMPHVRFAAVPTWGTTPEDAAALMSLPNVEILPPVDDIDDLLRQTKVMLVPSVWAEARSRIVVEAMSRGVPVVSSNAGGIPEAHLGVPYMLPVNVIHRYKPSVDLNMVPIAEVPPQDVAPWHAALERLVSEEQHWREISAQSRQAALEYARSLTVEPFEQHLQELLLRPKKAPPALALSEEKRKLLAMRLKQKAATKPLQPWFAGIDDLRPGEPALFCFPYAGGGTLLYRGWKDKLSWPVVAIRLPGRESRLEDKPFESMEELISALLPAIEPHLQGRPFTFFGHSMGAGIAFELTRALRHAGGPVPQVLIVSAARAPQFRSKPIPGPDPTDAQLVEQVKSLEGVPREVLDSPELLSLLLPALRADTHLYRRYTFQGGEPLNIPIRAYTGLRDPNVRPEHMSGWAAQTTGEFRLREFHGGHFYLQTEADEFLPALVEDLQ